MKKDQLKSLIKSIIKEAMNQEEFDTKNLRGYISQRPVYYSGGIWYLVDDKEGVLMKGKLEDIEKTFGKLIPIHYINTESTEPPIGGSYGDQQNRSRWKQH
jgi:hypothetical protein